MKRDRGMSKNNNVNPGQYKVKGRERQGDDIIPNEEKAELRRTAHELREQAIGKKPQKPQRGRKS